MARPGGLGKGLGALIPAAEVSDRGDLGLSEIPVGEVQPNPHQPRERFDEEALASLGESIREVGVLQPILVRRTESGYELIAGERRLRAARRVGLPTIPAMIRSADELSSLQQAIVENVQREQLNPLEEAAAFQQLIDDFSLTHDEVASRVGKSRVTVTNTMRLLQLPASIQGMLLDARLTMGHARALLGTPDRAFQEQLAKRAVAEGLSVRAVEDSVREREGGPTKARSPKPSRSNPPGLLELEELLSNHLDTRVKVSMSPTKGRVVIEFADVADLERIYRVISH